MRYAEGLLMLSIALSVTVTGCVSMAFESDLVPGTTPAPAVGTARFYIADVQGNMTVDRGHGGPPMRLLGTLEDLRRVSMSARPNLFSDDLSAVPLFLMLDCKFRERLALSAFLHVFTACTIPFPGSVTTDVTGSITSPTPEGVDISGSLAFRRRDVIWVTLLTPLGLIPVPGTSVIPRKCTTIFSLTGPSALLAQEQLTNAVCIEAVVKALGQCDAAKLQRTHVSCRQRHWQQTAKL